MKGKIKASLKQILSVVLSLILLASITIQNNAVIAFAESGDELSVSLGSPSWISENYSFKFSSATISGDKPINALTVSVDKGSISAGDATLTDNLTNHQTATWTFSNATIDTVQSKLRSIEFIYTQDMKVTVTVDGHTTSLPYGAKITSYDLAEGSVDGETHYYMFVPYSSGGTQNWLDAYNSAKSHYFMGMRGYLVTVTCAGEDEILDNITTKGAWAGGARLKNSVALDSTKLDYADPWVYYNEEPVDTSSGGKVVVDSTWIWVCGPEAGREINIHDSTLEDKINSDNIPVTNHEYTWSYYENWRNKSSDSQRRDQEPNNYSDNQNCEWWLQVHFPDSGNKKCWNDLGSNTYTLSNYIAGYFVEFSKYPGGYEDDSSTSGLVSTDTTIPFQQLTYTLTADDSTDTITATCDQTGDTYTVSLTADDDEYTSVPYTGAAIDDNITTVVENSSITMTYQGVDGTSYSQSGTAPTNVGTYEVKITVTNGSDSKTVTKKFEIEKAALTVTAQNQTVLVGGSIDASLSKASATGLKGDDKFKGVTLTGSSTAAATTSGSITPSAASIKNGSKDVTGNYNITYTNGVLSVIKSGITLVTAPKASEITYGSTLADSTINGDNSAVVKDEQGNVVSGTFEWKNPTTFLYVSDSETTEFDAVFKPTNSAKYDSIEFKLKVKVNKKAITVKAPKYSGEFPVGEPLHWMVGEFDFGDLQNWDQPESVDFDADTSEVTDNGVIKINSVTIRDWDDTKDVTDNYDITFVDGSFKTGKRSYADELTVEPSGSGITYGDSLSDSVITDGALYDNISEELVEGSFTWKSPNEKPYVSDSNSTEYVIKFTPTNSDYYDPVEFLVTIPVAKKALKLSAPESTQVSKGDSLGLDEDDIAKDGLVSGDILESIDFDADTNTLTPVTKSDVVISNAVIKKGTKDVTENYTITYVNGKLDVVKVRIDLITYPTAGEITYGDTLAESIIDASDALVKDKNNVTVEGTYTWKNDALAPRVSDSEHTSYKVVFTPTDDVTYSAFEFDLKVKVNKKDLTVKANNHAAVAKGDTITLSASDFTYDGLVTGDSVTDTPTYTADTSVVTSNGQIIPTAVVVKKSSEVVTGNYNITYVNGTFSVTKIPYDDSKTEEPEAEGITYGDTLGDSTITPGKLVDKNGNEVDGTYEWELVDTAPDATSGTNENIYKVIFTPNDTSSYDVVEFNVKVDVAKKELTIAAPALTTRIKDADLGLTKTDLTVTGLVTGDELTTVTISGDTSTVRDDGEVTVSNATVKKGTKDVTGNYDITYVSGTLKVVKDILTVETKPTVEGITYGESLDDSVINSTGAVVKDSNDVAVPGTYTWKEPETKPFVSDSNVTEYVIVFTPNNLEKYDEIEIKVTIQVAKRELTVTAHNHAEVAKGDIITLTASDFDYEGLADGDSVTDTPSYTADTSTVTTNGRIIPTAVIVKKSSEVVTGNYDITYMNGIFSVTKIPYDDSKTEKPTAEGITYGDTLVDSTITPGKLVDKNGNEVEGTYKWELENTAPDATSGTNENIYKVIFTPNDTSSYDVVEFNVKVDVAKKELTIAAPVLTTRSKDDALGLTKTDLTVTSLVTGDELTDVTISGDTGTVTDDGEVTVSNATVKKDTKDVTGNYDITYVPGTLKVVKVVLTVETKPSVEGITYGESLEDSVIDDTDAVIRDKNGTVVPGTYSWETPETKPYVSDSNTTEYIIVFTPDDLDKYDKISFTVTVDVAKKELTVTAKDHADVAKGDIITLDADDFTYEGLITGDSITDTPTYTADTSKVTTDGKIVPTAVVVKNGTLVVTDNYDITFVNGKFKVTKIPAQIDKYPTIDEITFGDSLVEGNDLGDGTVIDKNGNTVPGHFEWRTPDVVPGVTDSGSTEYWIVFIPDDLDTYDEIEYKTTVDVVPKSIQDDDVEIVVTPDPSGEPIVTITDGHGNPLVEGVDFEVEKNSTGDDEIIELIIRGKGNYTGEERIKFKKVFGGKIVSDVNIDENAKKYSPELKKLDKKDAETLLEKVIKEDTTMTSQERDLVEKIFDDISKDGESEKGGYDAKVYLEVSEKKESELTTAEIQSLTKVLTDGVDVVGTKISKKTKIGSYLDLALYMNCTFSDENGRVIYNASKVPVRDTSKDAFGDKAFTETVTITIPKSLRAKKGYTRKYNVIRIHKKDNGEYVSEILPSKKNGNNLTFVTDKFSTYALVYTQTKNPTPGNPGNGEGIIPLKTLAPKTADQGFGYIAIAIGAIGASLIGLYFFFTKKREEETGTDESQ